MVEFSYKGVNANGEPVNGVIEAVDKRLAVAQLTAKGHFATDLMEKGAESETKGWLGWEMGTVTKSFRFGGAKVSSKEILAMTSQLSTALRAGLPILNALEIITAQQHK